MRGHEIPAKMGVLIFVVACGGQSGRTTMGGVVGGPSLTGPTTAVAASATEALSFDASSPNWESKANGLAETGVIALRLDPKDWCQALLSSNGNDAAPQPLTMYRNRRTRGDATALMASHRTPDWYSDDVGYHMAVAAGRIDDDELQDVVVSVLAKHPADTGGNRDRFLLGGVKVYPGVNCASQQTASACRNAHDRAGWHAMPATSPAQVLDLEAGVAGVSLGDVNGDGRLDLAVAMFTLGPQGISPLSDFASGDFANGDVRVYLNENGRFALSPSWSPSDAPADRPFHPAAVKFADVDQDGLIDLLVGSDHVAVYFGVASGRGASLERSASWHGELRDLGPVNKWREVVGLDANWLQAPEPHSAGPLVVVAGLGCPVLGMDERCAGGFTLYNVQRGGPATPTWTSSWAGSAFNVKLADVDEHDRADLVVSSFWGTGAWKAAGGGLRIFRNVTAEASQPRFQEDFFPQGQGSKAFVGEGIAVADLDGSTTVEARWDIVFDERYPERRLYTVPALNVEDIVQVDRTSAAGITATLRGNQYASASGANWVSLAEPLANGEKIQITYLRSTAPDVAVGTFDGDRGILFFQNNDKKQLRRGSKMCEAHTAARDQN